MSNATDQAPAGRNAEGDHKATEDTMNDAHGGERRATEPTGYPHGPSARPHAGRPGNPHARSLGSQLREAMPAALLALLMAVIVVPMVSAVNWNRPGIR